MVALETRPVSTSIGAWAMTDLPTQLIDRRAHQHGDRWAKRHKWRPRAQGAGYSRCLLGRLVDEYAVAGINVHATVDCHLDGLPAAISLALYRNAQEALL